MNKYFIMIGLILLFSSFAFASSTVSNVDFNQPYVNKPTTFTVDVNDMGLEGIVRFVDNGVLITSQTFSPTNNILTFTYTWNVKEARTIQFYLADLNGVKTDEGFITTINIKQGLDLSIKDLYATPTPIPPNTNIIFTIEIENLGDEGYEGIIPIDIILDGNVICTTNIINIDINSKNATCDWLSPDTVREEYSFLAHVNRQANIPELTLTNNTMVFDSLSAPKANLYVKSLSVPQNIRRASVTNIPIIIGNSGGKIAENFMVNIYLAYESGNKGKVYEKFIPSVGPSGEFGFNFANVFENIGEYTITVWVDEANVVDESTINNNMYSHKIRVHDFNADQIYEENDKLRRELATLGGRLESCEVQKNSYQQSLLNTENQYKSCQSNLSICNTNNQTEIANWKKQLDGNQQAMINIMEAKYNDLLQEKRLLEARNNTELQVVTDEKNQWALIVVIGFLVIAGFIGFEQYRKGKPRKGINIRGVE
jgi:hypothetical protein